MTAISACLVVLDTSRVAAFAFPVIVIALAVLENYRSETELRRIFGAAAMVSLLAPNFEVIAGVTVKWLPPLFLILLLVFVA